MDNILRLWLQYSEDKLPLCNNIIIVGAGKFGKKALDKLSRKHPEATIAVIDSDGEKLDCLKASTNVRLVKKDGVDFLVEEVVSQDVWVIPAVPIHLTWELLARYVALTPISVPDSVKKKLPNAMDGTIGTCYTSYADFLCPDDCPEPPEKCTYTGKARPGILYETIGNAIPTGWNGIIFRSYQLAPGVGGYPINHVVTAREWLRKIGTGQKIIVATACRCHGVITASLIS
ncbi:MAG: NAD-binding protein [Deltaproteobacteria bacterium]|nr:NAD-binding protein [Deltaproteobacteria bacterium]MBW2068618.1 NAD-binding protein [Deltaproteobacteria bacterium]